MTREESITKYIVPAIEKTWNDKRCKEILEALEQEPCEDAISRKAVHEAIEKWAGSMAVLVALPTREVRPLLESIHKLPPVNPQPKTGHWIPVSERLPEEYRSVLVSTDAQEVFIADYLGKMNDGSDCFDDEDGMMWEGDVIAWMPLPAPFEPQESEEV